MNVAGDRETGVSLVFVAILLIVIFGFTAFAVDIAAAYQERRVLQNGADAAVLAIAEDCARGTLPCGEPYVTQTAEQYADANAPDLATTVEEVILDLANQEVTVKTLTHDPSTGRDTLSHFFAAVIGSPESEIRAEATAKWGVLQEHATIPLTISACDLEDAGGEGNLDTTGTYTIIFHDPDDPDDSCSARPGFDADEDGFLPAGFGWLLPEPENDCNTYTVGTDEPTTMEDPKHWAFEDPGTDPARGCLVEGEHYTVPVFVDFMRQTEPDCDDMNPNPSNCYGIGGYAHVEMLGFRFPGVSEGEPGCSPPQSCITVRYKHHTVTGQPTGDAFEFGVVVVELIR